VSGSLIEARDQALSLLNDLCDDALEIPLERVLTMSDHDLMQSGIAAKYKWLHDLIVDMAHELADADFSRDLQFKAANLNRERADRAEELLRRLSGWDHLPLAADGPFWQREIAKVIGEK
jgi:hypothetical protein